MGAPRADIAATAQLPSREAIGEALLADEDALVAALIDKARFSEAERAHIEAVAVRLVEAARAGRRESGGVDSFLAEYGLSSEEGVLLLCLAEALLRIPDAATADRLIAGTIGTGDWERHLGHSDSVLVNASTWGLMLTGHIVDWGLGKVRDLGSRVQRLIARSGEPVIRQALRQAMRILGDQFVLGETIEAALANAEDEAREGYRFSFDMLGEAARTGEDATRYTARYEEAVAAIAAWAGEPTARTEEALHARPGLSVKLSALHPRYEPSQEARLRRGARAAARRARARHAGGMVAAHHRRGGGGAARSLARHAGAAVHRSGARRLERARARGAGLLQARAAADRLAGRRGGSHGAAHPGAPGEGRLLGQRDQMGAGGGARRLSRVHPEGEHRRRLLGGGAGASGAARLLLSAIRHPQCPDHRGNRRACRQPAATSSSGSTAWARRSTARSCTPRRWASRAASMRRSAAIGTCSPISCAGCWRTAPIRPSSIAWPTTKRPSRASSPIRSRRRRRCRRKPTR